MPKRERIYTKLNNRFWGKVDRSSWRFTNIRSIKIGRKK